MSATKKTNETLMIPEGKITKLINETFNKDAIAKKENYSLSIEGIISTLDSYPTPPSCEDDPETLLLKNKEFQSKVTALRKEFREKYNEVKKVENALLAKEKSEDDKINELQSQLKGTDKADEKAIKKLEHKIKEAKSHKTEQTADLREQLNKLKMPLTRSEVKIFQLFDAKKQVGKGNVRIGKNVSRNISMFVCQVLHEMLLTGIRHLSESGMKVLHNKHVFTYIYENTLHPFYGNMDLVKKFHDMGKKELKNDESNSRYAGAKASHSKSKKDKQEDKSAKMVKPQPTRPSLYVISYECPTPNIKFASCVSKIWEDIKPASFKFSAETKATLAYFAYEFASVLVRTIKDLVDIDEMLTFKAKHFYTLVKTVSTLNNIELGGFLRSIKTDKKVKENGASETEDSKK